MPKASQPVSPSSNPAPSGWTIQQIITSSLAAIAIVLTAATLFFNMHSQSADQDSKNADTHIDGRIDVKLEPIHTELISRMGKVEGKLEAIFSGHLKLADAQKRIDDKVSQQTAISLVKGEPERILGVMSTELKVAQNDTRLVNAGQLKTIKLAAQGLPASTVNYWQTVADIVNYQSLLNQIAGAAPDPNKVSRPCIGLTAGIAPGIHNNLIVGEEYDECIIDLEQELFFGTIFKDSVIRYSGGRVNLNKVKFINCRFVLNLPTTTPQKEPARDSLLLALLQSPDLTAIKISTHN